MKHCLVVNLVLLFCVVLWLVSSLHNPTTNLTNNRSIYLKIYKNGKQFSTITKMKSNNNVVSSYLILFLATFFFTSVTSEDPYKFFTWKVTYGDIYPLGLKQQVMIFNPLMLSFLWNNNSNFVFIVEVLSWFLCFVGDLD